jgi:aldose sugar dehydrogenase
MNLKKQQHLGRVLMQQNIFFVLLFLVLTFAMSCASAPPGALEPVGETPKETGWKTKTVTAGLMHPWSVAWLPDGKTILATEREGRLRVIVDGQLQMDPVEGLPEILPVGQGGLLDIVVHPEFSENRWIYFTHSIGERSANRTALSRAKISEDLKVLSDVKTIFKVSQVKSGGQHFGSRLLWMDDGTLLMSIGDGGNPPLKLEGELIRENAQKLNSHLGKILRMDAEGKPPADNPFAGDDDPNTDPYIWSWGHRNIQGMALHPQTKAVWATEHGARGGDELNLIQKGKNYGWPEVTYSREYFGPRISDTTAMAGAVNPLVVWTPSIAPSGLTFFNGPDFPEWQGDMLAGGLVLRQIRLLDYSEGTIVNETTLQFEDRIRWVGQGPDGGLYVLTDEIDGRLLRLLPD